MIYDSSTIAAIATAPGAAGVSIVRISGTCARDVAAKIVRRDLASVQHGAFFHARFHDPRNGDVIDDGMVLVFHSPRSYTGEDVVELQGHGGRTPSQRLLDAALAAGARHAGPGEFTRRAFLNGKIDLTQAEAVADLISSRTERAARAAHSQLDGALGRRLDAIYDTAANICADLEAWLDVEEGEIDAPSIASVLERIAALEAEIAREIASGHDGRILREGALVVISGVPNVGKSSLLNALLGTSRAIVSNEPGTTRDIVEEGISIEGIPLRLADTAGLRAAPGAIEREGVARAREIMSRADLHIHLLDASGAPLEEQFANLPSNLPREATIIAINKCDLAKAMPTAGAPSQRTDPAIAIPTAGAQSQRTDPAIAEPTVGAPSQRMEIEKNGAPFFDGSADDGSWTICNVSAVTGEGLDGLRQLIVGKLGLPQRGGDADVAVAERHRAELEEARIHAGNARETLGAGPEGCVLAANELRATAEALGRITGKTFSDELLDRVFNRFCVGK